MADFLITEAEEPWAHLILTHGASEPMDGAFLTTIAEGLADHGVRVARFEFDYLAQRRTGGSKRPPPKMPVLEAELSQRIADYGSAGPLFIGGKSMGGRVSSLIADQAHGAGQIAGVLCYGYPFHPSGKPESLRTAHLEHLSTPLLICHGTRDPLGTAEEVAGYALSDRIEIQWLEDGDHGFKPRKRSGFTLDDHMTRAIEVSADFMKRHAG
ncbi:MAG: alpha/beta family hydrolase [Pseudomonadota bacterium]